MPDSAAPPVLAPATELMVTPEMIDAGVAAYYENAIWGWESPGGESVREMMAVIFRAMSSCSHCT